MKVQRLFVGNIPAGTSEQELKQEFASYGPVKAIDLKSKTNPLTDSVDTFAFVNIELDDRTVWQIITEFRQEQYKGVYLNVSKAKESFLDRLKREREETEASKQSSDALNPYKKPVVEEQQQEVKPKPLPALPTIATEAESSSSESSSESEDEAPEPVRRAPVVSLKPKENEEDQLVRKWNQETYIEHGKLKIVSITGQVKEVIEKSKNRKQQARELDDKARLADEKRKQGLTNLNSAYEQQKLAIQAALAGGASAKRKKIVFDDDDVEDQGGKKAKLALFDDEDGEDGFKANFTVRKQLAENSEKGQRLFEMQTQFHGDSRFKLDERFLADDTVAGRKRMKALEKEIATLEKGTPKANNQERTKQLEILSKVTGRQMQDRDPFRKDESGGKAMQRFDPSAQGKVSERLVKKEKKALTEEEIIAAKRAERPDEDFKVSEDTFYKVTDNMTQVLGGDSGGFSLLSMFGNGAANYDPEEHDEQDLPLGKPEYSDARFKYESSASEDEGEVPHKPAGEEKSVQIVPQEDESKKKKKKAGYFSKQGIWKENFFFLPGDVRLEEGRKFFLEFASAAAEASAEKDDQVKDIRKIFKKRRMRETKNVNQMRAKRGLKLMKGKRK